MMKNKFAKKLLAFALTGAMLLALAACTKTPQEPETPAVPKAPPQPAPAEPRKEPEAPAPQPAPQPVRPAVYEKPVRKGWLTRLLEGFRH